MTTHTHKINKDKLLAGMEKRGWKLDPNSGWIVPQGGQRIHQREVDWEESLLEAIECTCPHKETT